MLVVQNDAEEIGAVMEKDKTAMTKEDAVRLSASEGACYAYPGEDQQALRRAFCDGAVYAITGKLPE